MRKMKLARVLTLVGTVWAGAHVSAAETAAPKDDYAWMRGANYVPSYAKNDVAIWMDYDPAVIDRELGYAERLKLNTVRVFLQQAVYEKQPEKFLADFESFVSLCDKHKIKMMPVLFDSCFDPQTVELQNYRDRNWMPSPGFGRLGMEDWPAMGNYIRAVVGKYKSDRRIVLWDVMNEPESTAEFGKAEGRAKITAFLRRAIEQVRAEGAVQPLSIGWAGTGHTTISADLSDVLIIHNYADPQGLAGDLRRMKELGKALNKPVIINEFVGRPQQPIELAIPVVAKERIGWCFWELMIGKTQFSQGHQPYQGHIYPDGTCYDAREVAAVMGVSVEEAGKAFPQRRWRVDQAWEWYKKHPWIVGFNFVPSTACNTTEFWSAETFDEKTIDRELGWAKGLGFNTCRVFVQYLVWKHDPEGLKQRFGRFLALAAKHGLSTTPVLFDDCTFGDPKQTEPVLGKQRDPIPGMILPSWTPSPGHKTLADKAAWPSLEKYVKDMVGSFAQDKRVLLWDLYNEPGNSGMGNGSLPLVEATFGWARAPNPSQPLTMGAWGPVEMGKRMLELSDVISFHFYGNCEGLRNQIANYKQYQRPVINTEWMSRPMGSRWESDFMLFKEEAVGCYSWGLVNGRTQCQFSWFDRRGTPQPAVWFHDLFHADGRPYDPAEHTVIRATTADKTFDWEATDYSKPQSDGLKTHSEDGIDFSKGWTRWTGAGPRKERLHYAKMDGRRAEIRFKGTGIALIHKAGPDCGIARILVDGQPAAAAELDTYAATIDWNRRTVAAQELAAGEHILSVQVTGKKNGASSDAYVQLVSFEVLPVLTGKVIGAGVDRAEGSYRGWDAVCLSNRYVSLQIVPSIGGRVMQYALGGKNFMWVNPGLAGKVPPPGGVGPENAWLNYGGDKLWPAPQGWDNAEQWPGPPDAILDGGPYKLELLPQDGAGAGVRLTSGEDKRSGIQFSRVIRLHEGSTHVSFEATMKNIDTKPRRWGIWSHCQLDGAKPGGGHNAEMNAYCPLNPKSHFTNGYAVIFGDEKNPSFQADAKRGLMRVQYQYKVGKIGLDSNAGWVATVDGSDGRVFVQRFAFETGKEYPDGSSVEFWLNGTGSFRAWGKDNVMSGDPEKNPYVFESEVLSPFAKLQPGESYTWRYDWYAASIGIGPHEVTDCTDVGVVSEPLRAKADGKKVRLTGRFGVFALGRLALRFLDRQGQVLGSEKLPEPVSPLTPVVLDRAAKLPDGTATVRLVFVDAAGKEVGEIAKTDENGK